MPNEKMVESLRKQYPKGTRVRLVEMNDKQAPPRGTCGTVFYVDAMATIHINWDNGSTLGAVYGVDRICKVGGTNMTQLEILKMAKSEALRQWDKMHERKEKYPDSKRIALQYEEACRVYDELEMLVLAEEMRSDIAC